LGSEVQRKAAGIISIEKDDDPLYSVIKPLKVRAGSPLDVPQYIMAWDNDLKTHITKGEKFGNSASVRKQNELLEICKDLFSEQDVIPAKDLTQEFMSRMNVQDRTARKYIKTLRDAKIIISNSGENGIYRLV
jgi:predicted transcriptional regulator